MTYVSDKVSTKPIVLHLDHTVEAGGAELALVRLVSGAVSWNPVLLLPKQPSEGLGIFESIKEVAIRAIGPAQKPGVTSKKSLSSLAGFLYQVVGQALAVRASSEFREADVVHANTSRAGLYGAMACMGTRKKLVLHLRDHVSEESMGRIGYLAFKNIALRRADGLIGNSKTTLKTATGALRHPGVVAEVIHSPIGIDFATPQISGSECSDSHAVKIGMVARVDPWKGQLLLLQAFAKAFPSGGEELYFAGGSLFGHDEYWKLLQKQVHDHHMQGRVHFLGHVENVGKFLKDMNICVQASVRPEPLGQNVLQYLAQGKAVVAANEGGPTEWIRHDENGLLFQARDVDSLAFSLKRLADSRDLMSRLQNGALSTPHLLTDSEISDAHGRVFSELAKKL